jgi:hypothetical protein
MASAKPKVGGGVPVWRYYTVVAVVGILLLVLGYNWGVATIINKHSQQAIENLKEDSISDAECLDSMPNVDDSNFFEQLHQIC